MPGSTSTIKSILTRANTTASRMMLEIGPRLMGLARVSVPFEESSWEVWPLQRFSVYEEVWRPSALHWLKDDALGLVDQSWQELLWHASEVVSVQALRLLLAYPSGALAWSCDTHLLIETMVPFSSQVSYTYSSKAPALLSNNSRTLTVHTISAFTRLLVETRVWNA